MGGMSSKSILGGLAAAWAAALLSVGCSFTSQGNWKLLESGYDVDVAPYSDEFAIRVHVNELKQLGGEIKSAEYKLFVSERLKRHGVCPRGWEPLPCTADGSCVSRTRNSVTVLGRCLEP
jgi:hypothetical protein